MAEQKQDGPDHQKLVDLGTHHLDSKKLSGGKCTSRHNGFGYKKDCSCSHRWQAAHRALKPKERKMYKLDDPGKEYTKYSTIKQKNVKKYRDAGYVKASLKDAQDNKRNMNGEDDWVVMTTQVGAFESGRLPWPNDAHHIIPVGSFKAAILETVGTDGSHLAVPIRDKIMTAPYNINFWKNMIILPREVAEGIDLGLPTHKGSHPDYSDDVKEGLCEIMKKAFESDIKNGIEKNEDHENIEISGDAVREIVKLQKKIYKKLTSLGDKVRQGEVRKPKNRDRKATHENIKIDAFAGQLSK